MLDEAEGVYTFCEVERSFCLSGDNIISFRAGMEWSRHSTLFYVFALMITAVETVDIKVSLLKDNM